MQLELYRLAVLIFSVMLHEVAHGYVADRLGDPTARLRGRLSLNPLRHIDPLGSILLPGILLLTNSPVLIGYAKPVPIDPRNLRGKHDEALIAAAGPGTNIFLAVVFALLIRVLGGDLQNPLVVPFAIIVLINLLLAIFNLIPIPPLDGSKVLTALLPGPLKEGYLRFRDSFERLGVLSGTLIILLLFYYFSPYFYSWLEALFHLLTGIS